jgi:hypothetical protein
MLVMVKLLIDRNLLGACLSALLIASLACPLHAQTTLAPEPVNAVLLENGAGIWLQALQDATTKAPSGSPGFPSRDFRYTFETPAPLGAAGPDKTDPTGLAGGSRLQWKATIRESFIFLSLQTFPRTINETTRKNLGGPFFADWFKSAEGFFDPNWDDGNKFLTNYIAHPAGGAVYAFIFRQNSKYRSLLPGDPGYGRGVMLGMAYAAVASLNQEIGPLSEASYGNIGMENPDQQGFVDPVITPTLGAAWMVMEDYLYKNVLAKIEGRTARAFWHVVLNPARSTANVCAGRKPWDR